MTRKPYDDLRVREAIAYAIRRQDFVDMYSSELAIPLYSLVPSYAFGALKKDQIPEELWYTYNPEKAKKLLAEAGFPNGLKDEVLMTESSGYLEPFQIIVSRLKEVGINIDIKVIDHAAYHARIREDANSMVLYRGGRPPVADVFLRQWYHSKAIVATPTGITNFSHYGEVDADGDGKIDSIDELTEKAASIVDKEKQKEYYEKAQLQMLQHQPAYPIYLPGSAYVRAPYISMPHKISPREIYTAWHITHKTKILKH